MAKNQSVLIKDTVYKLQLALLEGIQNENQLFAAGSLMSRSDYEDVVTERSIANLCGYPLCHSNLSSDNTRKGRYRVSLKEHKVYDLQETYKYCSSTCLINSRAFSARLQDERCSVMNPEKLEETLRLFENLSLDSKENTGNNRDLGLEIQEKIDSNIGEVPIEDWMGPSNAIEGYVPHRDHKIMTLPSKDGKESKDGNFFFIFFSLYAEVLLCLVVEFHIGEAYALKNVPCKRKNVLRMLKWRSGTVDLFALVVKVNLSTLS